MLLFLKKHQKNMVLIYAVLVRKLEQNLLHGMIGLISSGLTDIRTASFLSKLHLKYVGRA